MMPVAKAQCIDLLLNLLERFLVVITHPQIFFHGIIFLCRNINGMIPSIGQTLGNHKCIPCICLHPFSLLCQHGSWRKDHTFHTAAVSWLYREYPRQPASYPHWISYSSDIHPNFDYSIYSGLFLYAVIPVTIVLVQTKL